MKKTEKCAYNIIKKRHKEVNFREKDTPDFDTSDNIRYEVKVLRNKKIYFRSNQIKKMKDNDVIMVFNKNSKLLYEFNWKNRKNIPIEIHITKYVPISIPENLKKKLHLLKIKKNFKTWDKLFKDMINKYK